MAALVSLLVMKWAYSSPQAFPIFSSGTSTNSWSRGVEVTYRIPCLVESKGVLLAFASERLGSSNDESSTNIVLRRSSDGGGSWSNMSLVVSAEVWPPFAPHHTFISSAPWAVADSETGDVLMFYNQNSTTGEKCDCAVWYVRTTDGGLSWSAPSPIPPASGVYGSSLDTGITLQSGPHKGRLLICMRRICKNSCPGPWQSYAAYSDDHGQTWHASPYLEEGSTECQVTELSDGTLYMSIRPYKELLAKSGGWRAYAISTNGGASFSGIKFEPQLVNAGGVDGSVISAHRSDGMPTNTVFFSHPDASSRSNLTLYTSTDNAKTWTATLDVYSGAAAYSSLAMLPQPTRTREQTTERDSIAKVCQIGLAFEKDEYKSITFAAFPVVC